MKSINATKIIISRSRLNDVTNADRDIINSANQRRPTLLICHFLSLYIPVKPCAPFALFLLPINFPFSLTSEHPAGVWCWFHISTRPSQWEKAQQSLPKKILAAALEASSRTWMWTSPWKWGIMGMKAKSHLWDFRGTLNWELRAKHSPCQIWSQHKQSEFSVRTPKSSGAPVSCDFLCISIYLSIEICIYTHTQICARLHIQFYTFWKWTQIKTQQKYQ